jgi:diguanylate cyclase (GGDEF)-like protein
MDNNKDSSYHGHTEQPESDHLLIRQAPALAFSDLQRHAEEAAARLEEIRTTYQLLIQEAKKVYTENEKAFRDIKQIRHVLIGSRTLSDLITNLVHELRRLDVQHVSVSVLEDMLGITEKPAHNQAGDPGPGLSVIQSTDLMKRLKSGPDGPETYIGPTCDCLMPTLFEPEVQSCVIAPLVIRDRLIGSLNLGSKPPERFAADLSTDLLEDLAATLSLCIDSVISHERNERLAVTDPLTGVYNRRYFFEQAAHNFELAKRHKDQLSCIYVDLNNFKNINDTYGHELGDLALQKLTDSVKKRIRRTDVLARLGGDEFALLLPRISCQEAVRLAEALRKVVTQISFEEKGLSDLKLSAAFGVSSYQSEGDTLEDLVHRADLAMFENKAANHRD